jgi:hypothetical protein
MNIEELKQDNTKTFNTEEKTIVTVWLPIRVKTWYKAQKISKSKVLTKWCEEQQNLQKVTETPKEEVKTE